MDKYIKGDIILENCGCKYKVLKVTSKSYRVQHIQDKDVMLWDKSQCEKCTRKDI